MKKLILFGAGKYGELALRKYGENNIFCFCDNSVEKQGTVFLNRPVYSVEKIIELYDPEKHVVMITSHNIGMLIGQLKTLGIEEYLVFESQENILINRDLMEEEHKEQNERLEEFVSLSNQHDLIEDVSEFVKISREVLKEHRENGLVLFHLGYQGEGHYYGNLETLIKYSKIKNYERRYAPTVSHNATLPLYSTVVQYRDAVVMSGEYYKNKIHEHYPYMPVFTVGPYIQYAEGVYSKEKVDKLKKKNGKTAVVFLPHSIEDIGRGYNKKQFIDDVLNEYRGVFNTFYLCAYWADIAEDACCYAQSKGMKLVTAGFRFDTKFNNRLKTIFDLSDAVIGGDRGTHFMYALFLGKKIARVGISDKKTIHDDEFTLDYEKKLQFDDIYQEYNRQFYNVINRKLSNTKEQINWIAPYCGISIRRTPEYIRHVLEISKDILIGCDGIEKKYPEAVRYAYELYSKEGNFDKMLILKNATGTYLD